jgi:hypothetical protein
MRLSWHARNLLALLSYHRKGVDSDSLHLMSLRGHLASSTDLSEAVEGSLLLQIKLTNLIATRTSSSDAQAMIPRAVGWELNER